MASISSSFSCLNHFDLLASAEMHSAGKLFRAGGFSSVAMLFCLTLSNNSAKTESETSSASNSSNWIFESMFKFNVKTGSSAIVV